MLIKAIKSKIITPKDNLAKVIQNSLKSPLKNGDILVVTSKVVAVTQGRISHIATQKDFDKLVKAEADQIIGHEAVTLTVKNGICIPWAGIDRSNIPKGQAILWPKEPFKAAQTLLTQLKKKYKLQKLGVLITDSHCVPLRRGVSGIALGYAGFHGVNDLRGTQDLYGNKLKVTQQNMADMLAAAAHAVMGEGSERTPFVLVQDAPVRFTTKKINPKEPIMPWDECIYKPLYKTKINGT